MTSTNRTEQDAPRLVNGVPEGMLEHDMRAAIRSYAQTYGRDAMRDVVAGMVNDEYNRRKPDGNRAF